MIPARDTQNEWWGVSTYPLGKRGKRLAFLGQLLEGNFRKIRLGVCMFNSHPHKLAMFIRINQDVFIDIFRLRRNVRSVMPHSSAASAIVSSRRWRRSYSSVNRIRLTSCRTVARVIAALLEGPL